ncbi:hypothetical protein HZA39_01525 [Candidatus Peregrinibacteria bacterium]|nr:hypothetical protein [Candidatus Peregrinibacteria bacterium]
MWKNVSKKALFVIVFTALGFLAMQVPFSNILGSNIKFNLFDFYGPIAGAFMGSIWGLVLVAAMQFCNWAFHGFSTETSTLIRFFPMLLSVLYFARKTPWILLIPGAAMIAFWIHPEGRQAWYYAFYWIIPFAMYFLRDRFLFARALGATFTAHCVGSVLFLWLLNLKAPMWIGLIPIVWMERGLMAIGITLTYMAFNFLLSVLVNKAGVNLPFVKLNPKYSLK